MPEEFLRVIPKRDRIKGEIYLVPTAVGLYKPLDKGFAKMASILGDFGYCVKVLEFPGQNKRSGRYSVYGSCIGLTEYLKNQQISCDLPMFIFGICTGALSALYASLFIKRIASVFCWEISPTYEYSYEAYNRLVRQFGLVVDWDNALRPIQPVDLISKSFVPIKLGISQRSRCTKLEDQENLATLSNSAEIVVLKKTSHIPGIPDGSESVIAEEIDKHFYYEGADLHICEKYS